jgi:hypothetical protein
VTPIDCTLAAQAATRWVVCLAPWMPLSVNCTKLMYVGLILSVPGVTFDLDSFGFEVLICGSSAKHNAAPKKQSVKINPVGFIFIRPIESGSLFPVNISLFRGRTIWIVDAYRRDGSASLCVQMKN